MYPWPQVPPTPSSGAPGRGARGRPRGLRPHAVTRRGHRRQLPKCVLTPPRLRDLRGTGQCGQRAGATQANPQRSAPRPSAPGRLGGAAPRGPSQAPGPLLGSSTHQELEHDVSEQERRVVAARWAVPIRLPRCEGRNLPSASGSPPAPPPRSPHPEAASGAPAPPGGAPRNYRPSGRPARRPARSGSPSRAGLGSCGHSESEAPVPTSRFCKAGSGSQNMYHHQHPSNSDAQQA